MHSRVRLGFSLSALFLGAQLAMPLTGQDSPFKPPAAAVATEAPTESIEFAGVSRVGDKTDLIFFDRATKKHRWVPLGETVDGLAALKYDAQREQAIVRIDGVQKTLPLRKGGTTASTPAAVAPMHVGFATPAPVPAPITAGAAVPIPPNAAVVQPGAQPGMAPAQAPAVVNAAPAAAPQPPMTEQGRQEQEARMLVSDLLEIGMAQRKAYEEAQRRAQSGEPATPPGTPPNPNAPQTQPAQQPQQPNTAQPTPTQPPGGE